MSPPPITESALYGAHRVAAQPRSDISTRRIRNISESTIDDAYVSFILHANPSVPRDVNTTELRRVFHTPPRSDGKSFSIYTLWQLIRKLESKELKTWSQLAIELGVEPPSAEKGQSAQKIQQYAVRLKRWMRAMHVDAFFENCLGKPHPYSDEIPSIGNNPAEEIRDGVPLEEDLALRALMPEWRPKRGRRKNEDKESDNSFEQPPAKYSRLDLHDSAIEDEGLVVHSAELSNNAEPWTAYADHMNQDTWIIHSAIPREPEGPVTAHPTVLSNRRNGDFSRWSRDVSPAAYPQSAITLGHQPPDYTVDEPHSAITPSASSKSRPRRRNGTMISSAWSSTHSASNGRHRGRPPAAKPGRHESHVASCATDQVSKNEPRGDTLPIVRHHEDSAVYNQRSTSHVSERSSQLPQPPVQRNKLQLQVPERHGGPVRLATPPRVLLNGTGRLRRNSADFFRQTDTDDEDRDALGDDFHEDNDMAKVVDVERGPDSKQRHPQSEIPGYEFTIEDVARAFATHLLGIKVIGRPDGLSVDEANTLASKATLAICGSEATFSVPRLSRAMAIKCAVTLGVEGEMGLRGKISKHLQGENTFDAVPASSSHLSVRAVYQNSDGTVTRHHRADTSQAAGRVISKGHDNSGSDGGSANGAYNYTITIDANHTHRPHDTSISTKPSSIQSKQPTTINTNIELRDLLVPLPSQNPHPNVLGDDEASFLDLRKRVRRVVDVPASAVDLDINLDNIFGLGLDVGAGGDEKQPGSVTHPIEGLGIGFGERNARSNDQQVHTNRSLGVTNNDPDKKERLGYAINDREAMWKSRLIQSRREVMVLEEKLRRIKRAMLEVVMGS